MEASILWNFTTNSIDISLPFGWFGWILVNFKQTGLQRGVVVNDPLNPNPDLRTITWQTCPPHPIPVDQYQVLEFSGDVVVQGRVISIIPTWKIDCESGSNEWVSGTLTLAAETMLVKMKNFVFAGSDTSEIGITVAIQDNPLSGDRIHGHKGH